MARRLSTADRAGVAGRRSGWLPWRASRAAAPPALAAPGSGPTRAAAPPPRPGSGTGRPGTSRRPARRARGRCPAAAPAAGPLVPRPARTGRSGPGPAPLRRLTRFEYNNTVRDLLGDTTSPANALPAEELGNGFGNDAAAQAVSSLLAEQYATRGRGDRRARHPDAGGAGQAGPLRAATAPRASEEACARTIIEGLAPRAFRRPLAAGEADDLLALYRSTRALAGRQLRAARVAAVIEAVLQSPDFLYRVELGVPDRGAPGAAPPDRRRDGDAPVVFPVGHACPTSRCARPPAAGELLTADGRAGAGHAHAGRPARAPDGALLLRQPAAHQRPDRSRARPRRCIPAYTPAIGALMQEETQRLLEYEIFEGGGTWAAALTAPHTFVNGPLAAFYKLPGVPGTAFQKVPLDPAASGWASSPTPA